MFFVFGWGRQTRKNFGIVSKLKCDHCGNDDYWKLLRLTEWFTLFFIPVIPYSSEKYLLCPICEYGIKLDDAKFNELRPIAEANQLLIKGEITETDHAKILGGISSEEVEANKETEIIPADSYSIFCHSCGKGINNNAKFCKFCGVKIS